ncbi:DUF6491 family protein [Oceanicaulis sp.]|uniref:DUF6491 family protein n=1 Tax=Oceanicaulis sp. TaxID=1924941 RepID=UPI003BA908CF
MGLAATVLGAALFTPLFLSGAAMAQAESVPQASENSPCVRLVNINGYSTLGDQHLLLSGGANRHYLVTTRRSCYGLGRGMQIGLSFPDTTRICNARFEYLVVPDGGRCRIHSIEEVDDASMARRLIEARAMQSDGESQ